MEPESFSIYSNSMINNSFWFDIEKELYQNNPNPTIPTITLDNWFLSLKLRQLLDELLDDELEKSSISEELYEQMNEIMYSNMDDVGKTNLIRLLIIEEREKHKREN